MVPYDPNNIFQKIIDKEMAASVVYEDDQTIAFLDIQPVERGHTLVIPKVEAVTVLDLEGEVRNAFWTTTSRVARAIIKALSADGCNIGTNIGTIAGQEVFHAHAHIIPRHQGKERSFVRGSYQEGEQEAVRQKIYSHIENL